MPVKVKWLEGVEVPGHFAIQGHNRIFRVISYDGAITDLVSASEAAKLAFELQEIEDDSLGSPGGNS